MTGRASLIAALLSALLTVAAPLSACGGSNDRGGRPVAAERTAGERVVGAGAIRRADRSKARRKAEPALPVPLEQAAARLLLIGFDGAQVTGELLQHLAARDWAGVALERGNADSPAAAAALIATLRGRMLGTHGREPLVVAEASGGFNAVPGVGPPSQSTARSDARARGQAAGAAARLAQLGVRAVFAPAADLDVAGGPWAARGFSDDPEVAGLRAAAAVEGWKAHGIAPIVGHYPGEGSASGDPSAAPLSVGLKLQELADRDLAAFARAISRAPAVQLSTATYVAFDGVTPATLLPDVVELLRAQGFRGVIVSGNLAAASHVTGGTVARAAVAALKAGCDLLWVPGAAADQEAARRAIVRAVSRGEIPRQRIVEALARIDALRAAYGLDDSGSEGSADADERPRPEGPEDAVTVAG